MRAGVGVAAAGAFAALLAFVAIEHPVLTFAALLVVISAPALLLVRRDRILGVAVSLALVGTFFAPGLSGQSGMAQSAAALGGALLIAFAWLRTPERAAPLPVARALTVLVALTCLATALSPTPDWFYFGPAVLMIAVLWAGSSLTPESRQTVRRTVAATALILGSIAVAETFALGRLLFTPPPVGQSAHAFFPGLVRGEATTGQPLVLGLLLILGALVITQSSARLPARALGLAIITAGAVATGSASVVVVLVAAVLLDWFVRGRGVARFYIVVTGLIAALIIGNRSTAVEALAREFGGTNVAHRLGSLDAIQRLVELRGIWSAMIGDGWGSAPRLYASGIIPQSASNAIDNQFVATLAQAGLLGAILLVAALVATVVRLPPGGRVIATAAIVTFLSFDVMMWAAPSALLALALSGVLTPPASPGRRGRTTSKPSPVRALEPAAA